MCSDSKRSARPSVISKDSIETGERSSQFSRVRCVNSGGHGLVKGKLSNVPLTWRSRSLGGHLIVAGAALLSAVEVRCVWRGSKRE